MWFVWILLVIGFGVLFLIFGTPALCPRCGVELADDFAYPGRKVDHCSCGWREGQRP